MIKVIISILFVIGFETLKIYLQYQHNLYDTIEGCLILSTIQLIACLCLVYAILTYQEIEIIKKINKK
jgi:hypothetical protein